MTDNNLCEIVLTGTENREWQGSVYFPATGEKCSFQSLLELVRTVDHRISGENPEWKKIEE